jgi:purine-nucleoside phosphorylase
MKKLEEDSLVSASAFVDSVRDEHQELFQAIEGCDVALICFDRVIFDRLVESQKRFLFGRFHPHEMCLRHYAKNSVLVVYGHHGSSMSAIQLEELIALGVRDFFVVGPAGVLERNPTLTAGVLVPDFALSKEGVSRHYFDGGMRFPFSERLTLRLRAAGRRVGVCVHRRGCLTTDALYRETAGLLQEARNGGCSMVDMEASALAAVAIYHGVDLAMVLYASDQVLEEESWVGFRDLSAMDSLRFRLVQLLEALLCQHTAVV